MNLRADVHRLLEGDSPSRRASLLRFALAALIVANVTAVVLETVHELHTEWRTGFRRFETVSVAVFSIEYVARLWSAVEHPRFAAPITGRLRWMFSPAALIDLLSILPSLLMFAGFDLRALRLVRLSRLLRVAKLGRYSVAVQTLQRVLRAKAPDLLSLLFLLVVLLVVSSTCMYYLEHEAQPETFSSIPATMWWGIITLTTIGYGDMTPVTAGGRVFGGFIAVLGIGMFALPAGLLGAAFVAEINRKSSVPDGGATCPHCGKPLADP